MSDEVHHEIVIIRRGGHGDHDEHHGGVWKIAFADFMTAMMAFFLVMWLISANDKTRASVARYFNPVRLVDATTQPRGLHDTKKDDSGITASPDNKKADDKKEKPGSENTEAKDDKPEKPDKPGKEPVAETPKAREKRLDIALRENPFAALAEIVSAKPGEQTPPQPPKSMTQAMGHHGGEAFRDPFAPPPPSMARLDDIKEAHDPDEDVKTASIPSTQTEAQTNAAASKTSAEAVAPKSDERAEARKEDIKALVAALHAKQAGKDGPQVEVKQTEEGVLLSLTDTSAFSMFASGSAVPTRNVVLMMEKVAKVLKTRKGTVIVRGFTDSKPYKSGRYDNWHLSLDRAQVTHYMLVRGGLDDARIGHVEGYADRHAKAGTDPSSAMNRRIEILLKDAS